MCGGLEIEKEPVGLLELSTLQAETMTRSHLWKRTGPVSSPYTYIGDRGRTIFGRPLSKRLPTKTTTGSWDWPWPTPTVTVDETPYTFTWYGS